MNFTTANEYRQIECCLFDNLINRLLRNLQFRNDAVSDIFMASKNSKLLKVPTQSRIFRTRKSGVSLIICQWIECEKLTSKWLFFYLYFYANKACFNLTLKTKNKENLAERITYKCTCIGENEWLYGLVPWFHSVLPVSISKLES